MPADEQDRPAGRHDASVPEQGEVVPVPVAARRLGKSPDAIRSAIRRGKLNATKGNDGDWRVWLPPVEPDDLDSPSTAIAADLDCLRAELATAMRQAADSAAAVAELRERLARIEGEGEGRRLAAAAELAAAVAMTTELRDQLAWHRRPFWRRWWQP